MTQSAIIVPAVRLTPITRDTILRGVRMGLPLVSRRLRADAEDGHIDDLAWHLQGGSLVLSTEDGTPFTEDELLALDELLDCG